MSWVIDSTLTYFQKCCINVLKCGPIPKHLAFIMDGNRRFALKSNLEKSEGHVKGFDKLAETLQWCREIGITEVTVYAFSIENFKRSPKEVETLLRLATEKFKKLLEEREKIMAEGVCIRVIGNVKMLSVELQNLIIEAVTLTKNNKKAFLNIAFAYTSRDEIVNTAKTLVNAVNEDLLNVDDIDEPLFSDSLYTHASPNPDLIVRTSGEIRFSDFLLWQIANSQICFTDVLWPEFSIWHFLYCIFKYQRNCDNSSKQTVINKERSEKAKTFIDNLRQKSLVQLNV